MDPPNKRRRLAPKLPGPVPPPQNHQPILPARPTPEQAPSANPPNPPAHETPSPTHPERHEFETFAKHLQDAAMYIYRQGQRPPYAHVSALLLKWDDDVTASADVSSIERVLRDRYNFHTERWGIPAVANPSPKLIARIAEFLNQAGADHLLIIYYVGHGFVGPDNQLYWACNGREDSPKLRWDGVRYLFDDAQSDILLLLDSCASKDTPVAGSHGAKQVIAACAPETSPREPGGRTFTSYLTEALHNLCNGRAFNVQRLYDEILACQHHQEKPYPSRPTNGSQTLAHSHSRVQPPIFLTLSPGKDPTIDLAPVPRNHPSHSPPHSSPQHGSHSEGKARNGLSVLDSESPVISPAAVAELVFDEPRVLVCTTFVGDASPDMASFKQWVASTPSLTSRVAVEGMFLGPPTVLLISIPQSLWGIIESHNICFSLGYINSRNLIHLYDGLMKAATLPVSAPASHAPASTSAPHAAMHASPEDVEDGRTLLAARQAAVNNSHAASHMDDHLHAAYYQQHQQGPLPVPSLPLPQQSLPPLQHGQHIHHHLPPPSYNEGGSPNRYQSNVQRQDPVTPQQHHALNQQHLQPHHHHHQPQQQPQQQQQQQRHPQFPAPRTPLPRIISRVGSPAPKEESEDSAEMKEAAEGLKALSHIRPRNGDSTSPTLPSMTSSHLSKIAQDVIKCRVDAAEADDAEAATAGGSPLPSSSKKAKARKDYRFKASKSQDGQATSRPRAQSERSAQSLVPLQPQGGLQSDSQCNFCDHEPFKDASSLRKHIAAAHTRPFPCAFAFAGCTSTFGSKNEWKRHIASQHLCLQYYRCSGCSQSAADGKGNEFNRKDLFTQHLRRMHAPVYIRKAVQKKDGKVESEWEDYVREMQKTCCIVRRRPPQRAACPKPGCVRPFEGRNAWDDWTEHVGRHMENGEGELLGVDDLLIAWSLEEGIITRTEIGGYRLSNPMGNVGNNGGLIGSRRSSQSVSDGIKSTNLSNLSAMAFPLDADQSQANRRDEKLVMPPTPPPTTNRQPNEEQEPRPELEPAKKEGQECDSVKDSVGQTEEREMENVETQQATQNGGQDEKQSKDAVLANGELDTTAAEQRPEKPKSATVVEETSPLTSITVASINAAAALQQEKMASSAMEVDG